MIAYKYRIYPNCEQKAKIAQHFGCTRFVYNWGLETKMAQYQKDKTTLSCFDLTNRLKEVKAQNEWLKEVDSQSLQMALRNLDNAYTRFFREKKGFPKFRSKHNSKQSYQIPQRCLLIDNSHVKIPKLGIVKAKIHRECVGKTGTWTISRTPTGKYFVSIITDESPKKSCGKNIIGIDLGIKTYATCSDGNKIDNPKWLRNSSERLAVLQRRASKKTKGSNNRKKANLMVAKYYEKITNQRNDWQHKWSAKLVSENQAICLEDLNVAGMLKNHHLARSIQECAWSQFVSFLEYKAEWSGTKIIKIGRFEPSSKLCSCGYLNKGLTLADREWTCPSCLTTHDRDLLASQNILKFGLKLLSGQGLPVEPVEMLAMAKSEKQEAQP